MLAENIILIVIAAVLVGLIILAVVLFRFAKKKLNDQVNSEPAEGSGDDGADLLELLAYYRQQYHQRQIPQEVYEAHEREIAAKLKERRERREREAQGSGDGS